MTKVLRLYALELSETGGLSLNFQFSNFCRELQNVGLEQHNLVEFFSTVGLSCNMWYRIFRPELHNGRRYNFTEQPSLGQKGRMTFSQPINCDKNTLYCHHI